MKLSYLTALGLFLLSVPPVVAQQTMPDGPYLFYRNGKGYLKSISQVGGKPTFLTDSFTLAGKAQQTLKIPVNGHPDWTFSVTLKTIITPRQSTFTGAAKMLFLSDIEGEFAAFRSLLLANKVIDEHYRWTYGKGQLIIAGDLFDRGHEVVPYLWLLYKLEDEARAKGGDVHVLLGNHDIMNLKGDFRYVEPAYQANAKLMNENYAALYAANTELGQWLRSKNIIEKIGDCLVMHAGLSPNVLRKGFQLERINTSSRPFYATPTKQLPDSLIDFLGNKGLFWYRGYFMAPKAGNGMVDSTLTTYGVKTIVVGHTIVARNIALYYGGKILGIDVNEHKGHRAAALYEKGKWYAVDDKGAKQKLIYTPKNDHIREEDID